MTNTAGFEEIIAPAGWSDQSKHSNMITLSASYSLSDKALFIVVGGGSRTKDIRKVHKVEVTTKNSKNMRVVSTHFANEDKFSGGSFCACLLINLRTDVNTFVRLFDKYDVALPFAGAIPSQDYETTDIVELYTPKIGGVIVQFYPVVPTFICAEYPSLVKCGTTRFCTKVLFLMALLIFILFVVS